MKRILPFFLFVFACNTSKTQSLHIDGYEWAGMKKMQLQSALDEISGIAYDATTHDFLAINDEQGLLYVLNGKDYKIKQSLQFGKAGDYECVATDNGKVFVLKSNGDIHSMNLTASTIENSSVSKFAGNKIEFESTLWNETKHLLYVISKKSAENNKLKATKVYVYDPERQQYLDTTFSVSWKAISDKNPVIKDFHASAAAIQPNTGDIFLLSSIEKLLVVLSADWNVKAVHQLDSKLFQQPEGITFDKGNNLYITNEAAGGVPTLIFIPYK